MVWWWKRQDPESTAGATENTDTTAESAARNVGPNNSPDVDSERGYPRHPQVSPIPEARDGEDLDARWELIKRDLLAVDPDFFEGLAAFDVKDPEPVDDADLSDERVKQSLRRLSIRYLIDEAGAVMAMWERHALQVRREGPDGDILVLRARAFHTVPVEWTDRAYTAVNEWNRTRRFMKAYVGDLTESGRAPLYGEIQLPLRPGLSDELLDELIDCAAAVSGAYVDWLHGEGAVF